jgi:DNA-binding transcriptional ArsR family regulator
MNTFMALPDPTRRQIVELLGRGERSAGAISGEFDASAPAISQHLKVLRQAGLVRVRAQGQHRFYSIEPRGLEEVDVWLKRVRRFWTDRLDALEDQLNQPARKTRKKR